MLGVGVDTNLSPDSLQAKIVQAGGYISSLFSFIKGFCSGHTLHESALKEKEAAERGPQLQQAEPDISPGGLQACVDQHVTPFCTLSGTRYAGMPDDVFDADTIAPLFFLYLSKHTWTPAVQYGNIEEEHLDAGNRRSLQLVYKSLSSEDAGLKLIGRAWCMVSLAHAVCGRTVDMANVHTKIYDL